ncbi:unnamed protein product, partial [Adineta ricciae]
MSNNDATTEESSAHDVEDASSLYRSSEISFYSRKINYQCTPAICIFNHYNKSLYYNFTIIDFILSGPGQQIRSDSWKRNFIGIRPEESRRKSRKTMFWIRRIPVGSDKILYWVRWDYVKLPYPLRLDKGYLYQIGLKPDEFRFAQESVPTVPTSVPDAARRALSMGYLG